MSTVKLDVAPESLGVLLTVLTESLDDAWEHREYLQTELTKVSNELTDMYSADHPERLRTIQIMVQTVLDLYGDQMPTDARGRLDTALTESRRRPDDPN